MPLSTLRVSNSSTALDQATNTPSTAKLQRSLKRSRSCLDLKELESRCKKHEKLSSATGDMRQAPHRSFSENDAETELEHRRQVQLTPPPLERSLPAWFLEPKRTKAYTCQSPELKKPAVPSRPLYDEHYVFNWEKQTLHKVTTTKLRRTKFRPPEALEFETKTLVHLFHQSFDTIKQD